MKSVHLHAAANAAAAGAGKKSYWSHSAYERHAHTPRTQCGGRCWEGGGCRNRGKTRMLPAWAAAAARPSPASSSRSPPTAAWSWSRQAPPPASRAPTSAPPAARSSMPSTTSCCPSTREWHGMGRSCFYKKNIGGPCGCQLPNNMHVIIMVADESHTSRGYAQGVYTSRKRS